MARSPRSETAAARRLSPARVALLAVVVGVLAVGAWLALTLDLTNRPGASLIVVGGSPLLDKPAPDFELVDLDGRTVRLADYAGRPVLVNFWASWCIPCREEFPLFQRVLTRPDAGDLAILGVVYRDSADAARGFMESQGARWPALVDAGEKVAQAYGVALPPMTFYVDRAGIVRAVSYGPPPEGTLEQYLARIR
jgi:cytochrome c biogenesis protein CcmG/thiol:disulfide interchange protein DsbE